MLAVQAFEILSLESHTPNGLGFASLGLTN
jgi:hypothetical protein